MLRLKIGREVGPYWVEVESDTLDGAGLVKTLEEKVAEVNGAINDVGFEQTAAEIPSLPSDLTPTEGIMTLLKSNYGLRPRTLGEIKSALEASRIYYPVTTISSILASLGDRGKIRRWKVNGKYVHQKARG